MVIYFDAISARRAVACTRRPINVASLAQFILLMSYKKQVPTLTLQILKDGLPWNDAGISARS
jgi:hypothetical protein